MKLVGWVGLVGLVWFSLVGVWFGGSFDDESLFEKIKSRMF